MYKTKKGVIVMENYNNGYLLWIADLKVKELLKEREIERIKTEIKTYCGLSNNHVDETFLSELRQAYYNLQEIQEELERAKQKRAEHLKKYPTQKNFSEYGFEIENTDNENNE